jgi:hypothetical protein
MRVLSTQAQHADTDLDVTMKFPIQFFRPTLAAVMAMALVGCGGGGSGSEETVIPNKTVTVIASGLNEPKHMVFSDGNLYVADQGARRILNVTTGQTFVSNNARSPIGLVFNGSNLIWSSFGHGIYMNSDSTNSLTGNGNWYGLAIFDNKLYAANNSPNQILAYNLTNFSQINIPNRTVSEGSVQGLAVYGGAVYVTVSNSGAGLSNNNVVIKLIDTANGSGKYYDVMNSWGVFSQPNAIVFDGNYAYIANYGTPGTGDGGYISRKYMLDNSPAERYMDATIGSWGSLSPGFCGLAGLAVNAGYLYASNGTCTSNINSNTILKIKL